MSGPLVSVVMAVFNAEKFLSQSIESILSQSYGNFEFIIINDGSTDCSWEIVLEYQRADARIRPIRLERNQGVSTAVNTGFEIATGKYIARMDSDDISLPERLAKQVEFMESHPEIGILGGGMQYMDESGKLLGIPPVFLGDLSIRWHLMFESPFINSTTMWRKSLMDLFGLKYDPSAIYGEEDYELWSRFLPITKGWNLPDILIYYRLHPSSLSQRSADLQHEKVIDISCRSIMTLLPDAPVSTQEIRNLQNAIKGVSSIAKNQRAGLMLIYFRIWDEFCRTHNKNAELPKLEQMVVAWAARMILYPPFQPRSLNALLSLTRRNWKWPFFLLKHFPYYWARRRVG